MAMQLFTFTMYSTPSVVHSTCLWAHGTTQPAHLVEWLHMTSFKKSRSQFAFIYMYKDSHWFLITMHSDAFKSYVAFARISPDE